VKTRRVTRREVRDAALVGQIVAEADLVEIDVTCVVDDDDCCGHMLEEHCVAETIGASGMAVLLWLVVSNAISTPLHERTKNIATSAPVGRQHGRSSSALGASSQGPLGEHVLALL